MVPLKSLVMLCCMLATLCLIYPLIYIEGNRLVIHFLSPTPNLLSEDYQNFLMRFWKQCLIKHCLQRLEQYWDHYHPFSFVIPFITSPNSNTTTLYMSLRFVITKARLLLAPCHKLFTIMLERGQTHW